MKLEPDAMLDINEERDQAIASAWTVEVDPHHCHDERCRAWHAGTINLGINLADPGRLQVFTREVTAYQDDITTLMLTKAQIVELIQDLRAALSELT